MKTLATCLTIGLIGCVSVVRAQSPEAYARSATPGYGVPGSHYGFGGPVAGHAHHASTAFEGACRGRAAIIQAQAQYNLLTSLAMRNMAEVHRINCENQQAYAEMKTARAEAARQLEAEKRAANRRAIQERLASKRAAQDGKAQIARNL